MIPKNKNLPTVNEVKWYLGVVSTALDAYKSNLACKNKFRVILRIQMIRVSERQLEILGSKKINITDYARR